MNSSQMKNIIVLKNLPSNLIDEAFIILKNNKKIKSIKIDNKKSTIQEKEKSGDYIVKEAEMVISCYLSNLEKEKQQKSHSLKLIEDKYKKMKCLSVILGGIVLLNLILQIF